MVNTLSGSVCAIISLLFLGAKVAICIVIIFLFAGIILGVHPNIINN